MTIRRRGDNREQRPGDNRDPGDTMKQYPGDKRGPGDTRELGVNREPHTRVI